MSALPPKQTSADETSSADALVYVIRSADLSEGPRLNQLFTQLGYPVPEADFLRRLAVILKDPAQTIIVAGPVGAPVAFAHVQRLILLEADRRAELLALVVDETQRSLGLGARLLAAAEAWVRSQDCTTLIVRSNVMRDRAHAFYAGHGYLQIKSQHLFHKSLPRSSF